MNSREAAPRKIPHTEIFSGIKEIGGREVAEFKLVNPEWEWSDKAQRFECRQMIFRDFETVLSALQTAEVYHLPELPELQRALAALQHQAA